jgi:hypothetical protein
MSAIKISVLSGSLYNNFFGAAKVNILSQLKYKALLSPSNPVGTSSDILNAFLLFASLHLPII